MVIITKDLSFFLSWVSKTQPNVQTKLMMYVVCFCFIDCVFFFSVPGLVSFFSNFYSCSSRAVICSKICHKNGKGPIIIANCTKYKVCNQTLATNRRTIVAGSKSGRPRWIVFWVKYCNVPLDNLDVVASQNRFWA